jgi:SDR family mycofactocin-dependent oxidoreductase
VVTGRVAGKVAFITGVARGQGRAHAVRLASEGADIVGVDICDQVASVEYPMANLDDLAETVKLVEETGRRIIARVGDVRDIGSLRAVFDEGIGVFGHIDCVLANAGVMPIQSDTMLAWQDCLDVMLTGVLNTVEVAYPKMIEQGSGGSIVITGSVAGLKPLMRTVGTKNLGWLGYSAAKAALVNLAQNYASILAAHHIRVNTVHPTGVNTPMANNSVIHDYFSNADPEDLLTTKNAIPVGSVEPEDVANTVLFLCSDESRYLTGGSLRVDAGNSLR